MGGAALPFHVVARTATAPLDIAPYQDKTHLVLQKTPFGSLCRHTVEEHVVKTGLRFREESLLTLQESAEAHLIALLTKANKVAAAAKRETCTAADLALVFELQTGCKVSQQKEVKKAPVTPKSNLLRLFKRAGIRRSGADLYPCAFRILHAYVLAVLEAANSIVQSRHKQKSVLRPTVTPSDVAFALKSTATRFYGISAVKR